MATRKTTPPRAPITPDDGADGDAAPRHNIIGLRVRNVRTIQAIDLRPAQAGLIRVQGRNMQGKSSLIDSVRMLVEGKAKDHVRAIRRGTSKASVEVDTGTLRMLKQIEPGAERLVIKPSAGGPPLNSPQAILDEMRGGLQDPLDLFRMSEKDRTDLLLRLSGLADPLAEIQAEYDRVFTERTADGRLLKSAQGELTELPEPAPGDAKRKRMDPADVLAEQRTLQEQNSARDMQAERTRSAVAGLEHAHQGMRLASTAVAEAEQQLMLARKRHADAQALVERCTIEAQQAKAALAAMPVADLGSVQEKLAKVQANNAAMDRVAAWQAAARKVQDRQAVVDAHTATLQKLLDRKRQLLDSAAFPVAGLTYDGDNLLWNGDHITEISDAQRLQLAMAVCMAQTPNFRVLWIKNGDVLDKDSEALIDQMATANNFQVFIEQVRDRDAAGNILYDADAAVVIEDGHAIAGTAVEADATD